MKNELIWKDVPNYEGIYRVNTKGEVWRVRMVSCDKFEYIKQIGNTGKSIIALAKDGISRHVHKHTLIYDSFNEGRGKNGRIFFKDGNSKNIEVDNMFTKSKIKTKKGEFGLWTLDIPLYEVRQYIKKGFSYRKIAAVYGCSSETIRNRVVEGDVKKLYKQGLSVSEIKNKMKVSLKTVEKHLGRINKKNRNSLKKQ